MSKEEFNKQVKNAFDANQYNFVKRVNIVDMDEDDVPRDVVSQLVSADTPDGGHDTVETFEFVSRNFPNIKSGIRLKDQKDERMTDVANNLAISANIRLNALLALFMCGEGSMGSFYLKTELPEEVHSISSYKSGIMAISEQLSMLNSLYGVKYDRVTLNGVLLTVLTGEVQVNKAKKKLKAETGLKIDVDNSSYTERFNGSPLRHAYVPNDRLILSNSKNDKSDKFYFANLPVIADDDGGEEIDGTYGLTTYINEDMAWAVMRGIPVLTDPTLFSTIKFT